MRRSSIVTGKEWSSIFIRRIRVSPIAARTHQGVIKRAGGVTNGKPHGLSAQGGSMTTTDSIFQRALSNMLAEIFDGPPGQEAYLLNPGDPGLLRQLDTIGASAASTRPTSGKPPIAAHVDHLHFGLSILNRWATGEANPWAGADWNASWQRTTVTEDHWQALRDGLRHEADKWRKVVATRTSWDDTSAAAALSTAAHTAYHLGAIRQILAGLKPGE